MKDWLEPIYAPWDGNASAMARDIDELPVTVSQWRFRGRIPDTYWAKIIAAAAAKDHVLPYEAFIHPDKRLAPAGAVAAAGQ
jgi:hypothetical protein